MEYQLINPVNPDLPVITQVLSNRGMSLEDIEHYLHLTDEDILSP